MIIICLLHSEYSALRYLGHEKDSKPYMYIKTKREQYTISGQEAKRVAKWPLFSQLPFLDQVTKPNTRINNNATCWNVDLNIWV